MVKKVCNELRRFSKAAERVNYLGDRVIQLHKKKWQGKTKVKDKKEQNIQEL